MNMIWKGINEIVEQSIGHLEVQQEQNYFFYSAPDGHELILSGVAIVPPTWKWKIRDFGIAITGRKDRIFRRGFDEGDGGMVTQDEEPMLELRGVEGWQQKP